MWRKCCPIVLLNQGSHVRVYCSSTKEVNNLTEQGVAAARVTLDVEQTAPAAGQGSARDTEVVFEIHLEGAPASMPASTEHSPESEAEADLGGPAAR